MRGDGLGELGEGRALADWWARLLRTGSGIPCARSLGDALECIHRPPRRKMEHIRRLYYCYYFVFFLECLIIFYARTNDRVGDDDVSVVCHF